MLSKSLVLERAVGFEKLVFVSNSILSCDLNELFQGGKFVQTNLLCFETKPEPLLCKQWGLHCQNLPCLSCNRPCTLCCSTGIQTVVSECSGQAGYSGLRSENKAEGCCPPGRGMNPGVQGVLLALVTGNMWGQALFSVLLQAGLAQPSQVMPVFNSAPNRLIAQSVIFDRVAL